MKPNWITCPRKCGCDDSGNERKKETKKAIVQRQTRHRRTGHRHVAVGPHKPERDTDQEARVSVDLLRENQFKRRVGRGQRVGVAMQSQTPAVGVEAGLENPGEQVEVTAEQEAAAKSMNLLFFI